MPNFFLIMSPMDKGHMI